MDQQAPETLPSVELPSPVNGSQPAEQAAHTDTQQEKNAAQQLEQGISIPSVPQPVQPASQPDPSHTDLTIVSTLPDSPTTAPGLPPAVPQIADDTDLIEKEWVDKAKHIVERTKHDPHQQNKEINTMKADYLKKRYNKDIKLSE